MSSEGALSDRNHIHYLLITTGAGSQTRVTAGDGVREVLPGTCTNLINIPHDQRNPNAHYSMRLDL